jgi:hypothetical protein
MFQTVPMFHDFQPHASCWLNRSDLIFSHFVGDGLTALAYYLIPIMLVYITRKYEFDWRLRMIFYVYGTFIFLCGTTHLFDVLMIWHINNAIITFDGWLRVATGVFSMFAAGVTVWAVRIFLPLVCQLIKVWEKMRSERKQTGRATDETFSEYHEIVAQVKAFLHPKEGNGQEAN